AGDRGVDPDHRHPDDLGRIAAPGRFLPRRRRPGQERRPPPGPQAGRGLRRGLSPLSPAAFLEDAGLVAVPVAVAAGGALVEILLALPEADQQLGAALIVE